MDRTCDPCRVKESDRHCRPSASLGNRPVWQAMNGAGGQAATPGLHPFIGKCWTPIQYWCYVHMVNVLDPLRQYRKSRNSCDSSPSDGHGGSSTGIAAVAALLFPRRCFVMMRRGRTRANVERMRVMLQGSRLTVAIPSSLLLNEGISHDALWRAGIKPGHHHKAPSTSGRELTQLKGQCRGRTHVPIALCEPRRSRPCRRDRNEQACRPIYPSGPRNGRLEVECERSAGGSPQQSGDGRRHHRESRGSLFSVTPQPARMGKITPHGQSSHPSRCRHRPRASRGQRHPCVRRWRLHSSRCAATSPTGPAGRARPGARRGSGGSAARPGAHHLPPEQLQARAQPALALEG